MPRLISLGTMIVQQHGLLGTQDISEWEEKFIESVQGYKDTRRNPRQLSDKQIDIIERIYRKHFA